MKQILDATGTLVGDSPIRVELVKRLYRAMLIGRQYDRKSTSLQRQGRLATYASFEGQEAAQVGAAAALHPDDWMVATYRDAAAMWAHGYPMDLLFLGRMGDERGGCPPPEVPCLPPSITVGGHMIHAVGIAWAMKLQDTRRAALTMFGDGATSEGDFHEAMNFAAVYELPVVFFCQNNGYAISMAVADQTKSETIAEKASAYGMESVRVDGNDLLATYAVTKAALDRAKAGQGPTLIEAVTYRIGPHTTNDDPTRYRDEEEEHAARAKDPLIRVQQFLTSEGHWSPEWEQELWREAEELVGKAVQQAEALPEMGPDGVFSGMFAELTQPLEAQRAIANAFDTRSQR